MAARGLDVKDLVLVVNYDVPNHLEDYVHRVGRTGRAGRAGTAVTFIAPEEEQHAPDVVRALRESGAAVPADLAALAESFEAKRRAGTAKLHGSGFGGSGFKFSSAEDNLVKALRRVGPRRAGREGGAGRGVAWELRLVCVWWEGKVRNRGGRSQVDAWLGPLRPARPSNASSPLPCRTSHPPSHITP